MHSEDVFESSASAAPKNEGQETQTSWTCPYCSLRLDVEDFASSLWPRRFAHMSKAHPDKPAGDRVHHMRKYTPVVSATDKILFNERSWNCPFCDCGFPELGKWDREKRLLQLTASPP